MVRGLAGMYLHDNSRMVKQGHVYLLAVLKCLEQDIDFLSLAMPGQQHCNLSTKAAYMFSYLLKDFVVCHTLFDCRIRQSR